MRLRLLLPLLALVSLSGVTWMVVRSRAETPAMLLESARARLEDPTGDVALALRELEEGLRLASDALDGEVRMELLRERSRLHTEQGLYELALRDLELILTGGEPDPEVLAEACQLALWLEDPGHALELAERLEPLDEAQAHVLVGSARVDLGHRPLARVAELARDALDAEGEARAVRLAQRAAVLAADAETSAVAREELGELFPRVEDRRKVEELVDEAAEQLELGRQALVSSLDPGTSFQAVVGLQDLLLGAGDDVDAAELGEVALSIPGIQSRMPLLFSTVPALLRLGRREAAANLVTNTATTRTVVGALRGLGGGGQLLEWCQLLEQLELWDALKPAAAELERRYQRAPDYRQPPWSSYFLGLCDLAAGRYPPARYRLNQVALAPTLPSSMAQRTWLGLAEIARRTGNASEERIGLMQATRQGLEPVPERREAVAQAWDRLAEISHAGDPAFALEWATQALCLAPTLERFARWQEGWPPQPGNTDTGPLAGFRYAQWSFEQGDLQTAEKVSDAVLSRYPHLAPVLEVAARTALARQNYLKVVELTLELLELGWRSEVASGLLAAVPSRHLSTVDRLRWLRLDPGASLGAFLRVLVAHGELDRVALAVRTPAARRMSPRDAELAVRVLLESGDLEATRQLLPIAGEVPVLKVRLALADPHEDDLPVLLDTLEVPAPEAVPELLGLVDDLLGSAQDALAGRLLERLSDHAGPHLGAVLLRRCVLDLRAGLPPGPSEPLERAAALMDPGWPDLGRVFVAAARGDDDARRREARATLETGLAEDPARRLLLAVLAENPTVARQVLLRRAIDGRDPLLRLGAMCVEVLADELGRAGEGSTDTLTEAWNATTTVRGLTVLPTLPAALHSVGAHEVATVALAADGAPFAAWALKRIESWPVDARAHPWAGALAALARTHCGQAAEALAELDRILAQADAPAELWALRARWLDPEAALDDHLEWLERAGLRDVDDPGLAGLQATALERSDAREEALERLEAALAERPGDVELLADRARLKSTPGHRLEALQCWNELMTNLAPGARGAWVPAVLDNLRAARSDGEISERRWWTEVEALEAELPDDPAPVRELAERAFETLGPGQGRAQALQRMERFRARTLRRPIESLRAGEAARWTQLLARYSPGGAVDFAGQELAAAPYDPEVWQAWIAALIGAERWDDALADLELLMEIAPDVSTARLLALTAFFVRQDAESFLERLEELEALAPKILGEDHTLTFFRGVAALRSDRPDKQEIATQGWELWERRHEVGLLSQRNGRTLAISLFASGQKERALVALSQCLESQEGALAADVTRALGQLIQSAPPRARLATEPRPKGRPGRGGTRPDAGEEEQ
jgi:tetratricopeptide (TPR) repeat protein